MLMRRFIKGHLGLASTFWGFGVVGWILCFFVLLHWPDFIAQVGSPNNLTAVIALMAVLLGGYFLYTYIVASLFGGVRLDIRVKEFGHS